MTNRLRRLPALGLAAALTAGSLALAVPAAHAGTDPGTPSYSQEHGHHGLKHQEFTIVFKDDNPGKVDADGPVSGRGTDREVSETLSVFKFRHGNSVNVLHSDVSNVQPKINYRSCTATAYAKGHWLFDGGTGKYRHAFGFGTFTFKLFVEFKQKHGHGEHGDGKHHAKCDTDKVVHSFAKVEGTGKATLGQHHQHD